MKNLGTTITNLHDYERGRESAKREIVEMVRGMKCGGYYGCPRCGNQGICGSVVNETLDDIIKRLGER